MAHCPVCDEVIPAGSNCSVANSNCFSITGNGTDGDEFLIEPILSVDADQLLECGADGLSAVMPEELSDPPSVQAYNTTDLSIPNSTVTTITLNTELYDTDTMHSNSTNTSRITFTTAGTYVVTLNVAWKPNITGARVAQIRKNGSDILAYDSKRSGNEADLVVGHCITIQDRFIANDYVEGRAQQLSGGTLPLWSESYSPILTATRIA